MRLVSSVLTLVATTLAALAVAQAPAPAAPEAEAGLAPPPASAVVRAVSLGRYDAAADLVWLRTAQFIGAPASTRVQYAGMEHWIGLINELDPSFETPYFHGGILLSTLPGRQDVAASILEDAERNLVPDDCRAASECPLPDWDDPEDVRAKCVPCPAYVDQGCNYQVPLSAAFVAYFGQLDTKQAARFFCDARQRGGPTYLTAFTSRLSRSATTCAQLRADLGGISAQKVEGGSDLLRGQEQQIRILLNCEEQTLKHATQSFRLRGGKAPSGVQDLLDAGLLTERPWTPSPDLCWIAAKTPSGFALKPCSSGGSP